MGANLRINQQKNTVLVSSYKGLITVISASASSEVR